MSETTIEARWVPENPGGKALELLKDSPKPGMWEVVHRWPVGDGERHYVYSGANAERLAWARFYDCSAEIEKARGDEYREPTDAPAI